jgi:hypothetical protein
VSTHSSADERGTTDWFASPALLHKSYKYNCMRGPENPDFENPGSAALLLGSAATAPPPGAPQRIPGSPTIE